MTKKSPKEVGLWVWTPGIVVTSVDWHLEGNLGPEGTHEAVVQISSTSVSFRNCPSGLAAHSHKRGETPPQSLLDFQGVRVIAELNRMGIRTSAHGSQFHTSPSWSLS